MPGSGAIIYLGAQAFSGSEVRCPEVSGQSIHGPAVDDRRRVLPAMDWSLQVREAREMRVFDRACEVLGLEVDLLFFDTPPRTS